MRTAAELHMQVCHSRGVTRIWNAGQNQSQSLTGALPAPQTHGTDTARTAVRCFDLVNDIARDSRCADSCQEALLTGCSRELGLCKPIFWTIDCGQHWLFVRDKSTQVVTCYDANVKVECHLTPHPRSITQEGNARALTDSPASGSTNGGTP